MFEYYVLNYDFNKKRVVQFNIFNNISLLQATEREVRKYLRAPKKYTYQDLHGQKLYGYEAFCKQLQSLILWQEWARREYEISVGDAFEDDVTQLEKWDCYQQCEKNISVIADAVIKQYKSERNKKKYE